jgi:hypothetical protein
VEAKEFAVPQNESNELVSLIWEANALLHLVVLAFVEGTRSGEDGGRKVRDRQ